MCFWYLRRATDVSLPFTRLPLRRIPKKQTVIPAPSVLGPMPELNFPLLTEMYGTCTSLLHYTNIPQTSSGTVIQGTFCVLKFGTNRCLPCNSTNWLNIQLIVIRKRNLLEALLWCRSLGDVSGLFS